LPRGNDMSGMQPAATHLPPDAATFGLEASASASLGKKIGSILGVAALGVALGLGLAHFPTLVVLTGAFSILFIAVVVARPFVGLLVYTIVFLLRPGELYPVLAPLHLERVVGTLTLVSIFLEQHRREGRLLLDSSVQTRALFLFVLATSASVPFAFWRKAALDGLVALVKIVGFYLMIVHCVNSTRRLRWWTLIFAALILYIAATSLRSYVAGEYKIAQGIDRAVGVTSAGGDPNNLGTTLAAALPLFLLCATNRSLRGWRVPSALGAAALVVTQMVTGSRASLLGLLAGLFWLWLHTRHRLPLALGGLACFVIADATLPDQYRQRYATITNVEIDASSQGRLQAWTTGMQMFIEHPLAGVGIGCFGAAHGGEYSEGAKKNWLEAHSLYVQVLAETGLLGTIAFFSFVYSMWRLNRRTSRWLLLEGKGLRFEHTLLNAVAAGLVVLLVSGIFGHSLLRVTWYVYGAVGLAILRLHLENDPAGREGAALMPRIPA
jgi:probable O-glycosylation ligase (exosortase A-associated)